MPFKGFQVSDNNGIWKWARAEIIQKNKIVVSYPKIPNPVAVRYARSDNQKCANLYNKEGLPSSVFKTENEIY